MNTNKHKTLPATYQDYLEGRCSTCPECGKSWNEDSTLIVHSGDCAYIAWLEATKDDDTQPALDDTQPIPPVGAGR